MYDALVLVHPGAPVTRDMLAAELQRFYTSTAGEKPDIVESGADGLQLQFPGWTLRARFAQEPHVLVESAEIAERFGANTGKQDRIAACSTRFEVAADDDFDMEHFNDFVHVIETAQRLGEIYAFDCSLGEFV